ncbi:hypothetical protein K8B33_05965 [Alcanivorax sp. JB21]|uniref:hypothetical protein n=1 Tax=Alcanivorax limicola TaxID=2874102 RepID=UPI001CC0F91B|nr:hypothetical protein [Alcanivorax limicola]MBZ2188631.1 hypothetical protein [Alcanivorax limicola]
MHRIFGLTGALCSALLLAACSHYQAAGEADTATITFTSNNVSGQPMVCNEAGRFQSTRMALSQKPFDSEMFDEINKTLRKAESVVTAVPANRPVRVGVRHSQRSRGTTDFSCRQAAQFEPVAGSTYTVHFTLQGNQCGLDITDGAGAPVEGAIAVPWNC